MTLQHNPQPEQAINGPRIVVVGGPGAGKTTISRWLASRLSLSYIELDALYWGPDWMPVPAEEFRRRISSALAPDTWVVDGNYSAHRDLIWSQSTMLVWLDYPLLLILWRLWWRTLRRVLKREVLWNGNRESVGTQFFSRKSLFLYALQSHRRRRATYSRVIQQREYVHLQVVHLRSPAQTQRWLGNLTALTH